MKCDGCVCGRIPLYLASGRDQITRARLPDAGGCQRRHQPRLRSLRPPLSDRLVRAISIPPLECADPIRQLLIRRKRLRTAEPTLLKLIVKIPVIGGVLQDRRLRIFLDECAREFAHPFGRMKPHAHVIEQPLR